MFDVDEFLAGSLTARVATTGPTVRPTWYLWEDRAFWILTGPWAKLAGLVRESPSIAVTVDVCDVGTGTVRQVLARGDAEVLSFDVPRGRRLLSRYLGSDEDKWDARFLSYLHDDPEVKGTVWVRMVPKRFVADDLGYRV
ncbi:pyridoxamine 5'-phosphate oxidase family protein [Amycolatopsis alba]|uniref:pyridoxamine 5'-phosphate oxidase family protein n=1 Tax=Amycolatopsis alba TaxID=76020 RepID=UPI00036AF8BE|nr:pyridoxamine 5'-phosphate oxidase family protein [Amycolatopsis alba]